jgi:DNA repair protein RadC
MPPLRHVPLRERPAYRIGHVGPGACAVHELLAAVIGGPWQAGIALALLARYGSLRELRRARVEELAQWDGVGPARAAALQAALELGRRVQAEGCGRKRRVLGPADAAAIVMREMGHLEQEHLAVLMLDGRGRVMGLETVYKGAVNCASVRAADVFREPVRRGAAAVVLAQNRPGQDMCPSADDLNLTRLLVQAGDALDVTVQDHLVVSDAEFLSLRERGLVEGWGSAQESGALPARVCCAGIPPPEEPPDDVLDRLRRYAVDLVRRGVLLNANLRFSIRAGGTAVQAWLQGDQVVDGRKRGNLAVRDGAGQRIVGEALVQDEPGGTERAMALAGARLLEALVAEHGEA